MIAPARSCTFSTLAVTIIWGKWAYLWKGVDLDSNVNNDAEDSPCTTDTPEEGLISNNNLPISIHHRSTQNLINAQSPMRRKGPIAAIHGPADISDAGDRTGRSNQPLLPEDISQFTLENTSLDGSGLTIRGDRNGRQGAQVDEKGAIHDGASLEIVAARANGKGYRVGLGEFNECCDICGRLGLHDGQWTGVDAGDEHPVGCGHILGGGGRDVADAGMRKEKGLQGCKLVGTGHGNNQYKFLEERLRVEREKCSCLIYNQQKRGRVRLCSC